MNEVLDVEVDRTQRFTDAQAALRTLVELIKKDALSKDQTLKLLQLVAESFADLA